MTKTGGYKFYDKVATKFGNYSTAESHTTKYPTESPEKVFKDLLIKYSGKSKNALDLGCADGRFTLAIAPNFKNLIAIDLSKGMLKAAKSLQEKEAVKNVSFEEIDAFKIPYADDSFDIVYSRRGPTPFDEIYRLLKKGGYFINIGIGEKDTQELEETFGRGQNFGGFDSSRSKRDKQVAKKTGLKVIYCKDFYYTEYYPDYQNLDLFLQGVPIFTDYDSEKDKFLLEEYISTHQTKQGIALPRHRIVVVAQK
ncbi:class I SAM-dependent methyltransferase [Candidatus Daviesbacteria bacterium]|nr:class I SAM-dependent methyltransferase [Candidatus Daviesbacteria bacterium]